MKQLTYNLLILAGALALFTATGLTPRPVKYSMKELELYTRVLDSLRTTNTEKDSIMALLKGNLHVSEWNNKAVIAQLDQFTEK